VTSPLTEPHLGFGLGFRGEHCAEILAGEPAIDWFEAQTETYLVPGGKPLHDLMSVRERFPVALHGVSLSVGSTAPLDLEYLAQVKALAAHLEPAWISDHLCWTGVAGKNLHSLLPLPCTEEAAMHVASRVRTVQDILRRRIALENVASCVAFRDSRMPEWDFLRAVADEADCLILLDVNNLYVSSVNQGFDAQAFLDGVPVERVQEVHLAGHEQQDEILVDTHDQPVSEAVWALYESALKRFGRVSTAIERDASIPPLAVLEGELRAARELAHRTLVAAA
jgi:uncharacterized protein (UPF0276 family)